MAYRIEPALLEWGRSKKGLSNSTGAGVYVGHCCPNKSSGLPPLRCSSRNATSLVIGCSDHKPKPQPTGTPGRQARADVLENKKPLSSAMRVVGIVNDTKNHAGGWRRSRGVVKTRCALRMITVGYCKHLRAGKADDEMCLLLQQSSPFRFAPIR